MGNLNPKPVEIEYKGKTYRCTFTLNCIDEVQEHFNASLTDVINMIADGAQTARNVRFLVTLLLNESADAPENGWDDGLQFDEPDDRTGASRMQDQDDADDSGSQPLSGGIGV